MKFICKCILCSILFPILMIGLPFIFWAFTPKKSFAESAREAYNCCKNDLWKGNLSV